MAARPMMPTPPPGFVPIEEMQANSAPQPPPGFVPLSDVQAPQAQKASPSYKGTILPFSVNEQGEKSFDLNAGLPGMIANIAKSALGAATLPSDMWSGKAQLPSRAGVPGSVPEGDPSGQKTMDRATELSLFAVPSLGKIRTGSGVSQNAAMGAKQSLSSTLRQQSDDLYTEARNAGVKVDPNSFKRVVDGIKSELADQVDDDLTPATAKMLKGLDSRAERAIREGGADLKSIENLRRTIRAKARTPEEGHLARIARDKLDEWADALPEADVIAGDKRALTEVLPKARDLWRRQKAAGVFEKSIERAESSGADRVTAYKTTMRALANRKDFTKTFTKQEQEAIKRAAKGESLDEIARKITDIRTMIPAIGAAAFFNPIAAGIPAALGAARYGAGKMAANRSQHVLDLIAGRTPQAATQGALPRHLIPYTVLGLNAQPPALADIFRRMPVPQNR